VCPFIENINFASQFRDEAAEIAAMKTFSNSATFAPWREGNPANAERYNLQFTILNFLAEFQKVNYLDQGDHASWGIAFVLLHNAGFIAKPIAAPVAPAPERLTAAQQHIVDRQKYTTEIVGNDEHGVDYTEEMLDALPSKEALRHSHRSAYEWGTPHRLKAQEGLKIKSSVTCKASSWKLSLTDSIGTKRGPRDLQRSNPSVSHYFRDVGK
jgi:hypothetical protein